MTTPQAPTTAQAPATPPPRRGVLHRTATAFPTEWTAEAPFPGRWTGGASLVLGPLLLTAGVLLRLPFDFFFPAQLAARATHPTLIAVSYGAFAAGTVLLWPAVAVLAARIGRVRPGFALWGGVFTLLGLFARTFHAGADHLAFRLADHEGAAAATRIVGDTYGAFHVFSVLNTAVMGGWILLAAGAWRSRVLGPPRALALAATAALPLGVLKGTTPLSVVAAAGLCLALVPLGVTVLREGPRPRPATALRWTALVVAVAIAMAVVGQAG